SGGIVVVVKLAPGQGSAGVGDHLRGPGRSIAGEINALPDIDHFATVRCRASNWRQVDRIIVDQYARMSHIGEDSEKPVMCRSVTRSKRQLACPHGTEQRLKHLLLWRPLREVAAPMPCDLEQRQRFLC